MLVVEDQATARETLVALLEREPGFTVRQAGSLAAARRLLPAADVAILDLGLPDGDGAELIAELKAANPAAAAIVLTSSIDPADAARAVDRGAAAVLSKLSGLDGIVATVRRLHAPPP